MQAAAFQLNKVRRLILTQGKLFQFERPKVNDFGEPTDGKTIYTIRGVYHETAGYSNKTSTEATTIRKKALPMVLTLWESAKELHHQDVLTFNGKPYQVTEIKNIAEANLVADISLEEVQT